MLKILHIAPLNFAGVPYDFCKMHNSCGDYSRIVTLHKNERIFPEDICINLPLPNQNIARLLRKKSISKLEQLEITKAHYFSTKNILTKSYYNLYDKLIKSKIEKTISDYDLNSFEIIDHSATK